MSTPINQYPKQTFQPLAIVLILFSLIVSADALIYNGFPTTDDEQLFISVARNVAFFGKFDAGQMFGNDRVMGSYHGVEPIHPLLAAPFYRIAIAMKAGGAQALFFLTIIYSALSTVLVYLMAVQLGFSVQSGVLAAIGYSFATLAWPYSKSFFREPLISLLLLGSWWFFEIAFDRKRKLSTQTAAWIAFIITMIICVFTKVTVVVAIPCFFLLSFLRSGNAQLAFRRLRNAKFLVFLIGLIVILSIIVMFSANNNELFYRASIMFIRDAWNRVISISHAALVEALVGQLISPAKGLFLYSPICLLSIISFFNSPKTQLKKFSLPWVVLFGLVVAQALTYDTEWRTQTWGTRNLLPVIPLLVLAGLPIIEKCLDSANLWLRSVPYVLIGSGFTIQLGGVFVFKPISAETISQLLSSGKYGDLIWNPSRSEMVESWRKIFSGGAIDLALLRLFNSDPKTAIAVFGFLILMVCLSWFYLIHIMRWPLNPPRLVGLYLLGAALILVPIITLGVYRTDSTYFANRLEFVEACGYIQQNEQAGDVLVIDPYLSPAWDYFFNFECGKIPWYSLPLPASKSENLLKGLSGQYARIWYISEVWTEGEPLSPIEEYLSKNFTGRNIYLLNDDLSIHFRLYNSISSSG